MRPENVDPRAVFDDSEEEWVLESKNAKGRLDGVVRRWRADGSLRQEMTYADGSVTNDKLFHPDGALAYERTFDARTRMPASNTRWAPKGASDIPFPRGGLDPRITKTYYAYDPHGYTVEFVGWDEDGKEIERQVVDRSLDGRVQQISYASMEEASREWNEKGTRYYEALNRFIAALNGGGEDEAKEDLEEPSDDRAHMERYVLRTLEKLNVEGRGAEARRLFQPSFEPFSEAVWRGHGKTIRAVAALADRLLINADDEVYAIRGDAVEPMPDVRRFGVSKDKRVLALCYEDRVEVVGADGARIRRFDYPKSYGAVVGVDAAALSDEPFASFESLGIERVAVSNSGTFVVLGTTSGTFLLRPERAPRIVFPQDEAIAAQVEASGGEKIAVEVTRPEVELRGDDALLVVSGQYARYRPGRLSLRIQADLGALRITTDDADGIFGPSLFHSKGAHYLMSVGLDEEEETAVFTMKRSFIDAQEKSVLGAYDGTYSARTSDLRAVCEYGDRFLIGMSDSYLWIQGIDENTQDFVYVGHGRTSGGITSVDVTPDQKEIVVGTTYGAVWRLGFGDERGTGFATNMNLVDLRRWLFLRTFAPMMW